MDENCRKKIKIAVEGQKVYVIRRTIISWRKKRTTNLSSIRILSGHNLIYGTWLFYQRISGFKKYESEDITSILLEDNL